MTGDLITSGPIPAAAPSTKTGSHVRHLFDSARRAFSEFLAIPTVVIIAFLALAACAIWMDSLRIKYGWPAILPGSHASIQTLLGTVATSIITVTSITFSLLLVAVQQGASALTSQVYDQFLRRRANQVFFGFFVGLALYCLVTLAAVHPHYTPVYGAIVAFLLTVVALCLLIILIYSTIDQMRPVMIVKSIRKHVETARQLQVRMLQQTRAVLPDGVVQAKAVRIPSDRSGYLTNIDVRALNCFDQREVAAVVVLRSIGDYVSRGEDVLELQFLSQHTNCEFRRLLAALKLEDQRDLTSDAAYGIEQLTTIGWTSTSTAKSNPQPGILAVQSLRDLAAEWYAVPGTPPKQRSEGVPVIYSDNVPLTLVRGFESLAVVASESMQHQTLAAVYRAIEFCLQHVPDDLVLSLANVARRSLSALGDHVLTDELQKAMVALAKALEKRGSELAASEVDLACSKLAETIGSLQSRGTRASAGNERETVPRGSTSGRSQGCGHA